jgi:ceramide glucosyltransferase
LNLGWSLLFLLPIIGGSVFSILCVIAARRVLTMRIASGHHEPVTILKPCYDIDESLEENLRSFCEQDYASPYQVILCIQRPEDPCLPILRKLEAQYPDRVEVVVAPAPPTVNGKVQNMVGGLTAARHDLLVISDSDVRVERNYLRDITAPFADKNMGYVCSPYVIVDTKNYAEHLEALTFNGDFVPQVLFSFWSKAAPFCLGASMALHKSALDSVGGMAAMGAYLVEDFEMGRRLLKAGKRWTMVPHVVEMRIKLGHFRDYWSHQIYWDQNTRAANPAGFAGTIITRAIPFAVLYVLLNPLSNFAVALFLGALVVRMICARMVMEQLGDTQWQSKLWLLPFRDCLALVSWSLALVKRSFVWKGLRFGLTADGRIIPRSPDDARKMGL